MQRLFPSAYDFVPQTWRVPIEYETFADAHLRRKAAGQTGMVYIVKPDDGAHGDGIFLTDVSCSVPMPAAFVCRRWRFFVSSKYLIVVFLSTQTHLDSRFSHMHRSHVVQDYIAHPLIMDGFKFDLRLYVLILSVRPLRVCYEHQG